MYGIHGYWCNTKTFPMSCKGCGSRIFFFQCDHDSRVLFDELGWPWPIHDCLNDTRPSTPEPTDEEIFEALQGVQFSVRDERTSGLIHGTRRFNGSIDDAIVSRIGRSESSARNTMRMDPIGREETLIGTVTHRSEVSLESRFGIARDSIGARLVGGYSWRSGHCTDNHPCRRNRSGRRRTGPDELYILVQSRTRTGGLVGSGHCQRDDYAQGHSRCGCEMGCQHGEVAGIGQAQN